MDGTQAPFDRLGSYRIVRRIATGGTSDVLLAKAEGPFGFERQVVLKILLSQYRADDQFARMFAREAAAYARLSHASVVRLFDFFSHGDQLVMVLEFVDGLPLNRLRASLKEIGKTLPDTAALYVASHVFEALASAHDHIDPSGKAAPVIHRDVNPSNVLVGWNGEVKLADFGIARVTGVRSDTQNGLIQGTFGYMAPEQVNGADIGTHTDVYAAGLLLWEMLAHRKAIQRGVLPEIEILRAMADPHLVSLDVLRPDLHGRVREVVSRALEPDPRKRTMTAEEAWSLLRDVIGPRGGRSELFEMAKLIHDRAAVKGRSAEAEAPRPAAELEPSPRPPTLRAPALTSVTTAGSGGSAVGGRAAAQEAPRLDELDPIDIDKLFDGISLPDDPEPSGPGDEITITSTAPPAFDVEALLTESRRAGVGTPAGVPAVRVATPTQVSAAPARPQIRPSRKMTATSTSAERRASQELTTVAPVQVTPAAQRHPSGDTTLVSRGQFPPPAGVPQGLTPRAPEVGPISVSIPSVKSTLIMPVADMRTSSPPPPPEPSPTPGPATAGQGATPAVPAVAPRPAPASALAAPPTARGLPPAPSGEPPPAARQPPPIPGPPSPAGAATPSPPLAAPSPAAPSPAETLPLAAAGPPAGPSPAETLPLAAAGPAAPSPAETLPLAAAVPPPAPAPPTPGAEVATPGAEAPPPPPEAEADSGAPVAPAEDVPALAPSPFFTPARVLAVLVVSALSAAAGVAYVRRESARTRAIATASASASASASAAQALVPSSAAPALVPSAPAPSATPSGEPADAPTTSEASAEATASASAEASAPATASASVPSASAPAAPASAPAASAPAVASTEAPKAVPSNACLLKTTAAAPGHRVYVDGRVVVETPGEARVPCGSRSVQIGSAGKARTLDLPCGAELEVK